MEIELPIATNTAGLRDAVSLVGDEWYVHVNEGTDDLLRYLTRVDGEDKRYAYLCSTDTETLCIAPRQYGEAQEQFPGDEIETIDPDETVEDVIRDVVSEGAMLKVPETTPVGVVDELETFAGVEVVNEPDTVWCSKTPQEQEILRYLAAGVQHGIARGETVLSEATVQADTVQWNGAVLTTNRLRRQIQKALADYGLSDEGNIIIGAGPTCADLHFTGNDTIEPGDTVLIDLGPRGPHGYYGDITRTFIVGEPSDWAEETYDVVKEALNAAFDILEEGAGATLSDLYVAQADVIESYGYGTGLHESEDDEVGLYHGTGHGIGVRIHEKPFQTRDSTETLSAGTVLTVEPGIYDPSRGGVRLEDVVVITEDGYKNFMEYPYDSTPTPRESPPEFLEILPDTI